MSPKHFVVITTLGLGALALAPARAETAGCCAASTVLAQANPQAAPAAPAELAATKTLKLSIDGMSCGSCAAAVKTALEKLDGVRKIDIGFAQKGGTVEYDPAKVSEKAIVEAVTQTGFTAKAVQG